MLTGLFVLICSIVGFFTALVRDPLYLVAASIASLAISYYLCNYKK